MSAALSQTKRPGQDCSPAEPRFPEIPAKDIPMNAHEDSTGASEVQMPVETIDLNTVQSDVWNLFHLIGATVDCLMEMTYERDGKRDTELDRVAALSWIARDFAERIGRTIDDNFHAIERGAIQ